jgi:hypothetical protein
MKSLKMLGLAAIAALGLMAFVGASTASATTLCKTNITPCPANWHWPIGTSLHAKLKKPKEGEATAKLTSPVGEPVATCKGLTLTAELKETSATWLPFTIHTLDWENCSTTVTNIVTGKLTVMWLKEGEAEVVADETKVTVVLGGISCTYTTGEGTKLGTVKNGAEPVLNISTKDKKTESSFACPAEPTWDAEVVITEPNPVTISE